MKLPPTRSAGNRHAQWINTVNRAIASPRSIVSTTDILDLLSRPSRTLSTIRPLQRLVAAPRADSSTSTFKKMGDRTPPERLVSTFRFVTNTVNTSGDDVMASSSSSNAQRSSELSVKHAELEVKQWEGRVVFSETVPWAPNATPPSGPSHESHNATPGPSTQTDTPSKHHSQISSLNSYGSSSSPISISSDGSPEPLPRPRIRTSYTPLASTAYTPPRPIAAPLKPVHPFFQRDFRRSRSTPPPPAIHRPRMVAHYSSTEVTESSSQGSQNTQTQSSQDSWRVGKRTEIGLVSHRNESRRYSTGSSGASEAEESVEEKEMQVKKGGAGLRVDDIDAMFRDLALNDARRTKAGSSSSRIVAPRRPFTPVSAVPAKPKVAAQAKAAPLEPAKPSNRPVTAQVQPTVSTKATVRPAPKPLKPVPKAPIPVASSLLDTTLILPEPPFFSYKDLPYPPKVVYTKDVNEANDLLECMTGNVVGFDLEWPTKVYDPKTKRWRWEQGKTALMQIGDERIVVLMHVWHMPRLPIKAVEILKNKEVYKLGVQIRGDEAKLTRDYPDVFPDGIESIVDLSRVARKADPLTTGPGKALIALDKLARAYLGRKLDKGEVRSGDWAKSLDREQVDYAANDVSSSIEIYKALLKVARANNIDFDLKDLVGGIPAAPKATRSPTSFTEVSPSSESSVPPGVRPREWTAFKHFKSGLTTEATASLMTIKSTTVQSYIACALAALPEDAMTVEEKTRFLGEIPPVAFVRREHYRLIKRLRRDVGELASESEEEEGG